jgi:hypothetical protein
MFSGVRRDLLHEFVSLVGRKNGAVLDALNFRPRRGSDLHCLM